MAKEVKNIEQIMEELNHIVEKMERGEPSLEESFQLYADGMKLVKSCHDKIDKIEKKIIVLSEGEDKNEL